MLQPLKTIFLFFLVITCSSCMSQNNNASSIQVDEEKHLSPNTCLVIAKVISVLDVDENNYSVTLNIIQNKQCGSGVTKKPSQIIENVLIQKLRSNSLEINEEIEAVISIQLALGDKENYYIYNYKTINKK